MDELARKRAENAGDCRLWSAEDALEDLLQRVRSGEVKPLHIAIHFLEDKPSGGYRHGYTVAGATFQQHIALLNVALNRVIKDWCE